MPRSIHVRKAPPWPHAEASCGRKIFTCPLKKRVWHATGPAKDEYEKEVGDRAENVITDEGIEGARIYLRLYMIGKAEAIAKPHLAVCCSNLKLREHAKTALDASGVLPSHFITITAKFPLEQSVAAKRLAFNVDIEQKSRQQTDLNANVYAIQSTHEIGRNLFRELNEALPSLWATGGVFVQAEGVWYQLTVEHVSDGEDESDDSLEICGGQNSIEGVDEDLEEENTEDSDLDHVDDALSIASKTPPQSIHSAGSRFDHNGDSETFHSQTDVLEEFDGTYNQLTSIQTPCHLYHHHLEHAKRKPLGSHTGSDLIRIGVVMFKSSQGKRPELDYCLIALENQPTAPGSNQINLVDSKYDENRQLLIRNPITGIGDALTDTQIVVLLPMGPMNGVMIEGITRFRSARSESFQNLHVLQLDGIISDGNSGAAVINRASGVLCGHIVMGCPGTGVAYMVSAWEVFADLQSRGINISIPISHCENGEPDENFREHRQVNFPPLPTRCSIPHDTKFSWDQKNEISLTTKYPERATKASKPHEGFSGTPVNCSWEDHAWLKDMDASLSQSDFWSHFFSLGRRGLSSFKATILREFSAGKTLKTLQLGGPSSQKPVARIDERGYDNGKCLASNGIYTAKELFRELSKDELPKNGIRSRDADRKLVHVTNLDAWTALALAATCSKVVAPPLSEALYQHMGFDSSIGIFSSNHGSRWFELSFHLPFFAWRSSPEPRVDSRQDSRGSPLRLSRNLTFLHERNSKRDHDLNEYLYEAQTSLVVCGFSMSRWTSFSFHDAFFQDESTLSRSPDDAYHEIGGSVDIGGLKSDSDSFSWSPRRWFLEVLAARLSHVKNEWDAILYQLNRILNPQLVPSQTFYSTETTTDLATLAWTQSVNSLLMLLEHKLHQIWDTCDKFDGRELARTFDDPESPEDMAANDDLLHDIRQSIKDMRGQQVRLKYLTEQVEAKISTLRLRMQVDDSKVSIKQLQTSETMVLEPRLLAWMTILSQPLLITAAMFGCDDIIPFRRTWVSFIVVLIVITFCMVLVIHICFRVTTGSWASMPQKVSHKDSLGLESYETAH